LDRQVKKGSREKKILEFSICYKVKGMSSVKASVNNYTADREVLKKRRKDGRERESGVA